MGQSEVLTDINYMFRGPETFGTAAGVHLLTLHTP
jgi:hypothetical protein